jgi:glucokinase
LQGLENFDWSDYLKASVRVLNDAHAALLGESWLGAVAGKRNVFLLTLGTGVGGAILSEGHLLRGTIGRAGHLGHITLNPNGTLDIVQLPVAWKMPSAIARLSHAATESSLLRAIL